MYVQSFDSLEDMYAAMAAAEEAANEQVTEAQAALRDATDQDVFWIGPNGGELIVYGHTPALVNPTEDALELRKRGYLTGMAYSLWEPEGEGGDTHVSRVIPVSSLVFELGKLAGFPNFDTLAEHGVLARALSKAEKRNV